MQPQHEVIALGTAATLLKQARRVLRHAGGTQAAFLKQALERALPIVPPELEAPEPDEEAFFGALEAVHGAAFADEARGEASPAATSAPSSSEQDLRAQIEALERRVHELQNPVT